MPDPLAAVSTRRTPQSEQADPRQVRNHAGGFTFTIDPMTLLRRFLVLGTEGGTYYTRERELTREVAPTILILARDETIRVVNELVEISQAGRAPKQNATLFTLAACASLGDDDGRKAALAALPQVARTGTHLFQFVGYCKQFRGWGRGLRRAVADWYLDKPIENAAFQAVKYRQRAGWSHRDLLRLSHPKPTTDVRSELFGWAVGKPVGKPMCLDGMQVIEGFELVQLAKSSAEVANLIRDYPITWEMIPDQFINSTDVWEVLLDKGMPQTALMRQLPRLTRLGMLNPMGQWATSVGAQLIDADRLRRARVHPINVLIAQRTYAQGRGMRGNETWDPSRTIVDALDAAFYRAFGSVEPTNKRILLALDVSGSMDFHRISNLPITPREASAALALVTAATEQHVEIVGFTAAHEYRYGRENAAVTPLAISPRQRLDDVIRYTSGLPFGGTDCALPMIYATRNNLSVDTFVIYTDNETWAGSMHPHQALRQYRERSGINAKLVVVGMTATEFTIADPRDPGMLDVAGFDAAVPALIADFARGL